MVLAHAAGAMAQQPAVSGTAAGAIHPRPKVATAFARSDMEQVLAVFAHPVLPGRALVATQAGLSITDDSGRNWTSLPEGAPDKIGLIASIAFAPNRADLFYLGGDRGVFVTDDAGKTFRQLGSKAMGMASDKVVDLVVSQANRTFRTLIACHDGPGGAAGISVSHDAGRTWRVDSTELLFRRVVTGDLGGGGAVMAVARPVKEPRLINIYYTPTLGEPWQDTLHDSLACDIAPSVQGGVGSHWDRTPTYIACADRQIVRAGMGGALAKAIGPTDGEPWASVGATYSAIIGKELIFAYSPQKLGLVISPDGGDTFQVVPPDAGLPVGPLVKDDARVRANANGTVLYAVVNNELYIGAVYSEGIALTEINVSPAYLLYQPDEYAKAKAAQRKEIGELARSSSAAAAAKRLLAVAGESSGAFAEYRFTLTAKVICPPGRKSGAVTADLTGVGGDDAVEMFDDGKHGDGKAGDGVFGVMFQFNPMPPKNQKRATAWPGRVELPVTALAQGGASVACAQGLLAVYQEPETKRVVWDEPRKGPGPLKVEGGAVAEVAADAAAQSGKLAAHLTSKGGAWSMALSVGEGKEGAADLTHFDNIVFYVKAEGIDELYVRLRDNPTLASPSLTGQLGLVKEGFVEGGKLDGQWRRVTVPVARMLKVAGQFEPALFNAVVLSADTKGSAALWADNVQLVYDAPAKAPSPLPAADDDGGKPGRAKPARKVGNAKP
jgi:hypothetical protein